MKRVSEKWKWLNSVPLFATPRTIYGPWNSPGQNTGVGSCSLLQSIFPTQGSNPHCLQADSLPAEPPGKPMKRMYKQQEKTVQRRKEKAPRKRVLLSEMPYKHLPHRCALNYPWSSARLNQGILSRKFFIYQARSGRHSTSGIPGPPARRQQCIPGIVTSRMHPLFQTPRWRHGGGVAGGTRPTENWQDNPNRVLQTFFSLF